MNIRTPIPNTVHWITLIRMSTFVRSPLRRSDISSFSSMPSSTHKTGKSRGFLKFCDNADKKILILISSTMDDKSVLLILSILLRNMLNCSFFPPLTGVPVNGSTSMETLCFSMLGNMPSTRSPYLRSASRKCGIVATIGASKGEDFHV